MDKNGVAKKILVTGAPGWLGSRLVEVLCEKKYNVRCLVLKGLNTSELQKFGAEVVEGDVTKKETLTEAVKGIDTVVHCVGIIHPKKISDLYRVNTEGTKNMLEASAHGGVKKFVHISSNSVQGVNVRRDILMQESHMDRPYMHYGKSKWLAEQAVNSYQKQGKLQTVILRPCWFYGPGQPERQTRLIKMIKSGKPLIFGDGKNLRSMSYIDNVIQGIILAIEKDVANGQTYWIADKRPYSTNEIYQTIAELLGVTIKPRHVPRIVSKGLQFGDLILQSFGMYIPEVHVGGEMIEDIACDISKAERELGYKPEIGLREGMRLSIKWAKEKGQLNE
jgi:nucleoside-diphosphate-sugar epimerase